MTCTRFFASKGKNVLMNLIFSDFRPSTLFLSTSEYDITIGQL